MTPAGSLPARSRRCVRRPRSDVDDVDAAGRAAPGDVQALPVRGPTRGIVADLGLREIDDGSPPASRVQVDLSSPVRSRRRALAIGRDGHAALIDTLPLIVRGFSSFDRLDVEARPMARRSGRKHETLAIRKKGAGRTRVRSRNRLPGPPAAVPRGPAREQTASSDPRQRPRTVGRQVASPIPSPRRRAGAPSVPRR